jgi:hypothetical protein
MICAFSYSANMHGVHVLDDLLAPVGFDVDVDVRRAVPLRREEPFEQQPVAHRVDRGDAQGVADRAVGGRAAALAHDSVAAAELDQLPHHQEVAGEAELLDDAQLMLQHAVGVLGGWPARAVAARRADVGELPQVGHLIAVPGRDGKGWQPGGDQLQVEGQLGAQ